MNDDDWIKENLFPKKYADMLDSSNLGAEATLEEISQVLTQFAINWFPDQIWKQFGIKIHIDKDQQKMEEFSSLIQGLLKDLLDALKKASMLPESDICGRIDILSPTILKLLQNNPLLKDKKSGDIFDFFEDFYREILFREYTDSYLSKTKMSKYRNALYSLLDSVLSDPDGIKLYEKITEHDQFASDMFFVRSYVPIFLKQSEFLDRDIKRYPERTVYKTMEIYYDLAELYSKFIVMIRALIEFAEGKKPFVIDSLYKAPLSQHVGRIRKSKAYYELGEVDLIMRNSGSHQSKIYDRNQNSILFKDRKESEILTPPEVLMKTRELSSLVQVIMQVHNYATYKRLIYFHSYCKEQNRNQKT